MLDDGSYEAMVVDANEMADDPGAIQLVLTILAGPHKGEVLTITAAGLGRDCIELLAIPATLTVADGDPTVLFED